MLPRILNSRMSHSKTASEMTEFESTVEFKTWSDGLGKGVLVGTCIWNAWGNTDSSNNKGHETGNGHTARLSSKLDERIAGRPFCRRKMMEQALDLHQEEEDFEAAELKRANQISPNQSVLQDIFLRPCLRIPSIFLRIVNCRLGFGPSHILNLDS